MFEFYDPIHFLAWIFEFKKKDNISITVNIKPMNSQKVSLMFRSETDTSKKNSKIIETFGTYEVNEPRVFVISSATQL